MKILLVSSLLYPAWKGGGTARVAYELSRGLARKGHEVTVYTTDFGFSKREPIITEPKMIDGVEVYFFRNLSNSLAKKNLTIPYQALLPASRINSDFDIIHINEHRTILAIVARNLAERNSIPYVIQPHGSVTPLDVRMTAKNLFDGALGNDILRNAKMAIALTEQERQQIASMGVDRNRIELLPNGVDDEEYSNLPLRGSFRETYGISTDDDLILYLGRIDKIKGIDILLDTFKCVVDVRRSTKLALVGPDNQYLSVVKKSAMELGIHDNIIFTGALYGAEKIEAYVDSDVFVLPSRHDAFPMTLLEAGICGVPIIVSSGCGAASYVISLGGQVVENHPRVLAEAITGVLNENATRKEKAIKSISLVKKDFGWGKIVTKLELIYEQAISDEENLNE